MIQTCGIKGNPEKAACKLCVYWKLDKEAVAYPPVGECRRHAPERMSNLPVEWPRTRESDWCGEFGHIS